jgi:hypothetical protein
MQVEQKHQLHKELDVPVPQEDLYKAEVMYTMALFKEKGVNNVRGALWVSRSIRQPRHVVLASWHGRL